MAIEIFAEERIFLNNYVTATSKINRNSND